MTDKMKSELYKKFSQMNLEEDYLHIYGEKLGLFMAGADALESLIESQELYYVIENMNIEYEACRKCPKSGIFKGTKEECEAWIEGANYERYHS